MTAAALVAEQAQNIAQHALLRLVAADEFGYVKEVGLQKPDVGAPLTVIHRWGEPNKQQGITCLSMAPELASTSGAHVALIGRTDGSCTVLALDQQLQLSTVCRPSGTDAPCIAAVSLATTCTPPEASRQQCLTLHADGVAKLHALRLAGGNAENAELDAQTDGQGDAAEVGQFRVAPQASCMAMTEDKQRFVVGGNAAELGVWNVEKQAREYQAKGGKPNRVGLVEPPCCTAVAFLEPGAQGCGSQSCIVTGSAKHTLRLYDMRAGKRPQQQLSWTEARVTALLPSTQGCWAGNGQGFVEMWDLAANKMKGGLKGAGGAVRALARHPSKPLLATASLDRWIRVYDEGQRKLLHKCYTKQPLTALHVLEDRIVEVKCASGDGVKGSDGVSTVTSVSSKRIKVAL